MDETPRYNYTGLGLLAGVAIGGGLAVVLFASTGNAIYFTIAGIGAAIGLILGAGVDRTRKP